MSYLSRADLLRLLPDTPLSLRVELAALMGFGKRDQSPQKTEISLSNLPFSDQKPDQTPQKEQQPPEKNLALWYIDQYQSRDYPYREENLSVKIREKTRTKQPKTSPLLSPAQQQILWDQCFKHQQLTKRLDIPLLVKRLAQVKPIKKLPRLKRQTYNQECLLFLDRSTHLTPIWQDQMALARSLQSLLGGEHCPIYLLLEGITGALQKLYAEPDPTLGFDQLPDAAQLIFISDLGYYSGQAELQQNWKDRLQVLKAKGHSVTVLSPLSELNPSLPIRQIKLDHNPSQFAKLQTAVAGCLQAELQRIRQLRVQVAGGCLEDELVLWNHRERSLQATGIEWRLAPEYIEKWAKSAQLTDSEKPRLKKLQASWHASMAMETEGLEQLIEQLFISGKLADSSLLEAALTDYEEDSGQESGVYYWLASQASFLNFIEADIAYDPNLKRLKLVWSAFKNSQKNSAEGGKLLAVEGTPRYIKQIGSDLLVTTSPCTAILSTQDEVYDLASKRSLPLEKKLTGSQIKLRTIEADIDCKTLTQPDWSQRFWQNATGLFAAHIDNALFCLQPASAQHPNAKWICQHNPWSWASATGIDEWGLWADLQVKQQYYRLRWIKPGQFMMGSPETEAERYDNETEHRVTLTQGFWLGETSCTQAFWQAVMGDNLTDRQDDLQLPVKQISWDDCQEFIKRLLTHCPGFSAHLPSEAQWEYACRAGTQTAYWWGDELNQKFANNGSGLQTENQYPANQWGLKSMSGNVREWCSDWYGDYSDSDTEDPMGKQQGRNRVLRGGSWAGSGRSLRSARRFHYWLAFRSGNSGFRLAGGLDPKASKRLYTASSVPWNG